MASRSRLEHWYLLSDSDRCPLSEPSHPGPREEPHPRGSARSALVRLINAHPDVHACRHLHVHTMAGMHTRMHAHEHAHVHAEKVHTGAGRQTYVSHGCACSRRCVPCTHRAVHTHMQTRARSCRLHPALAGFWSCSFLCCPVTGPDRRGGGARCPLCAPLSDI